jgi:transcriptional regulator with XRE-family HTH domain
VARLAVNTHGFGRKLRAVRKRLGLSQDEIIRRGNEVFDRSQLIKLEKDEHKLQTAEFREAIARAYRLPLELIERGLEGKASEEEIYQVAVKNGAAAKSTPPPPPVEALPVNDDARVTEPAHAAMRWRATVALSEDAEEGDALRAMLKVPDQPPHATWGDYYIAAKRKLGVDYAHDPDSSLPPARAQRVNGRTQKRR